MPSTSEPAGPILFDAGLFIGALLKGDPRHAEARPLVEAARRGDLDVCTTPSILCEVYAALTWEQAVPRHAPDEAAEAVRLLIERPSAIRLLPTGYDQLLRTLTLCSTHGLTARRVHDARHAGEALLAGVRCVYTYDLADWRALGVSGIRITGPPSSLARLGAPSSH